ncbi:MAG: DUF4914 family protein [Phycisphaeraceae bacterium]|nr:DUF4914 family protein [Phycisphaeraceae bacterium]
MPVASPTASCPFHVPTELAEILAECPGFTIANSSDELVELAVRDAATEGPNVGWHEVAYDIPGQGRQVLATVCRVKNGIAANYPDPYMRRRDPDCMFIGDKLPTNKPRFDERFGMDFEKVRQETFEWLKKQELALFTFYAGSGRSTGVPSVVVAPANTGFFALGLALLQGILDSRKLDDSFKPQAVIYVAPTFRQTHFKGKQVVVHNRREHMHELFSFNLYPGPSAKKGVYGMLLTRGETEKWVTAHCSTVQVVTPYDNKLTIMHEGASGGGKSEMLEHAHRQRDGRLLLGHNPITDDRRYLTLPRTCELHPVTDDMATCHPTLQKGKGKITLMDAEDAWFIRVNHINHYGIDPHLEEITVHPSKPLLFLSIDAKPGSTALIWEHIMDEPGKPCPNPRVIVPREVIPDVVNGSVTVDVRSFGVRCPPCTREKPTYGILGLFHILPPALAWLWRLVAPRGHDNPSIVQTEGLSSEGVGSYWPFATGRKVDQANLLLRQIIDTPRTKYIICPNQHVGAWKVGFMPQWIAREYLARRGGARFTTSQVRAARCPLLGYALSSLVIEGQTMPPIFLRVEKQDEVGPEAYDLGAKQLAEFFHQQIQSFREPDLDPLGEKIIQACLDGATVEQYEELLDGGGLADDE